MADITLASEAPITQQRKVDTSDLGEYLAHPNLPNATKAVDKEHPDGSAGRHSEMSVLQQHVAFFDRNNDGIIYPWETFSGFRAAGFNLLWSFGAMIIINGSFSYPTLNGWIPSPLFPIYIKNVHKGKHGSDSEIYDTEGRFVPEKFEELFSKFDKDNKGGLTFWEVLELTEANRNVLDIFGWFAAKLEWGLTWLLAKEANGILTKESVRGILDGTFFENQERKLKKMKTH